ncbi:hypothetical protein CJF30_00004804 [Rutstroemia sp. NJR-2017a BBW]|nr:hypothetical protein CJF30_00004804 [Rutstroemia sp. NJR-2017a BBW]
MSTPRIYLTRLTVEEHFDDFWEIWRDERGLVWSYVLFLLHSFPSPPQSLTYFPAFLSCTCGGGGREYGPEC